jgi:acid phosphatase type 7
LKGDFEDMRRSIAVLVLSGVLFSVYKVTGTTNQHKGSVPVKKVSSVTPIIAAAGDIACDRDGDKGDEESATSETCHMQATSDLLKALKLTAVLSLGDNQYENGTLEKFQKSYAPTWGQLLPITHPVAGNHEYETPAAAGYYTYFGAAAGDPTKGYYSYTIGQWHLIALNANCAAVGGCQANSPQEKWLKADLAAHSGTCTLAYWHQPRFSSALHGNNKDTDTFWQDLYRAGTDIVLNGHDHDYERFAPQTPNATADPKRGIREFVVGTGGRSLYPFVNVQPNSEVRNDDTYGILQLKLYPNSYDWKFIPEKGKKFSDSGRGTCHLSKPT